jgi:ELWxxDGT repeat protein
MSARPAAAAATAAAFALAGIGVSAPESVAAPSLDGPELRDDGARTAPASRCGDPRTPSSEPSGLVDVGGTVFLSATDGVNGDELWRSTGTTAGTRLVKNIGPGRRSSHPYGMTNVDGKLFFTADDGVRGRELWTSDGTRAGTVLVRDIAPEEADYYPDASRLTAVGDTLFFTADDGVHGQELWRSDGTRSGTVMVKDVVPAGSETGYRYEPSDLTAVGDTLFFTADDGVHGQELWRSDGTRAGTVMVEDIRRGTYNSEISFPAAVRDTLFFAARDGTRGEELWRSDGTQAGTRLVKDIVPDDRSPGPSYMAEAGGALFFVAPGDERYGLWTSDGTEAGTVLIEQFDDMGDYGPSLTEVGSSLFFTAGDGIHGEELWRSDGTERGTVMVKDINPDPTDTPHYSYGPLSLTASAGRIFFSVEDGIHGRELWTSDGTEAGTVMVEDINQGGRFSVTGQPRSNPRNGSVRATVRVAGAGRLRVGPARGSTIEKSAKQVRRAGSTTLTLRPTELGTRRLERALRDAQREGKRVGKVKLTARFTFTPCGGEPSSRTRRITLKLR